MADPNAIATQTFETFTNGGALGLTSPWGINGAPAFVGSSAAAVHGSIGARLTNSSGYSQLEYNATDTADRVYSHYLTLRTVSNAFLCGSIFDGATGKASWRINADRTVAIRNASNVAIATSTQTIPLDVAHRIAWRINAAGTQELRVYAGESTTPLFALTGACGSGQRTSWRFGVTAASAGNTIDIDTVRVGSDWMAPYGTPVTPPAVVSVVFDVTDGHRMIVSPATGSPAREPDPDHRAHR